MMIYRRLQICSLILIFQSLACMLPACSKGGSSPGTPASFQLAFSVNGLYNGTLTYNGLNLTPAIRFSFSEPVSTTQLNNGFQLTDASGAAIAFNATAQNKDSIVLITPSQNLAGLSKFKLSVSASLRSATGGTLTNPVTVSLGTGIDSADKFPRISDSALLDLVQSQTLKYFWDFGHPISGMARERATATDLVTTGGTGFGIMGIITGIQRNFISRSDGLARIGKIVSFLTTSAQRYHGAFPHWLNGATGATMPFSTQDDGGDIVETAYLIQGLLCARQYFSSTTDPGETALRSSINDIWNGVDWNWYRQNGQNTLYWNWSPDYAWAINLKVSGWCEALITYVLAASANQDSIPAIAYTNGWALNGAIINNKTFYNTRLPLGPDYGGPLFFAHYSFLGIDPRGLSDAYANYWTQDTAHSLINYKYCVANPKNYYGYSAVCWGLTASDEQNGYSAHSPTNDNGVVSPTAAISSLPYTPQQSMNALRFFYYTLGDKLWKTYGFIDAFNLSTPWFDPDFLAIDQGPEIVMIENYRSGLLWNLFMSCPEIKTGLKKLGFQSPKII